MTLKVDNIQNENASEANVVLNTNGSISIPSQIKHVGDDDTLIEFETNTVKLQTGGTTRVKVDSSGRALIGGNEPVTANFGSAKLQVANDGDRVASFMYAVDNSAGPHVNLVKSRGGASDLSTRQVLNNNDVLGRINFVGDDGNDLGCDGAYIEARIDGTPASNVMPTELLFYTNDGVQFSEERMKIGKAGDVTITDGNLVIGTAGHGIDFSNQTATSATGASTSSEVLDHYEEGTWTATLSATGATFTTIAQVVRYTKIGNTVHLHGYVQIHCSAGAGANALSLTGLPFPAQNTSNFNQGGLGTSVNRLDNSNGNGIHFLIQPNTSFLNMRTFDNVSGETRTRNLVSNDVTQANFSFQLQVTYQTSA